MPFTIDTDNLENDEFSLTENGSGDLVMEHKSTGATLVYNSTEDQWEPSGGIKTPAVKANELNNNGSDISLSDTFALDGEFAPLFAGAGVFIDFVDSETIADTNRVQISDNRDEFSGFLVLAEEDSNYSAVCLLTEGRIPTIISSNPSSEFSTIEANDGTINIVRSGATQYVENYLNRSGNFSWWVLANGK